MHWLTKYFNLMPHRYIHASREGAEDIVTNKTLWIILTVMWAVLPAWSQELGGQWPLPPEPIPKEELAGFNRYHSQQDLGSLEDSLSNDQLARRMSRLYRLKADLLLAQADGRTAEAAGILDKALAGVEGLLNQPGIKENGRFRELYRSLVAEHDDYFGKFMEEQFGEVFDIRREMFGMLDAVEDPLAEATSPLAPPPVRTTIPMTENRSVEQAREWLLTKRRDVLIKWMHRAKTYFPMIEKILEEEGLPNELKYLAVIESGLNPRARSRSHAVGMWQFIGATGRAVGLESDSWKDDRMDPVKATRAAARHLRDLYAQYYEDWHVALAGYNCSPRCIKRAIRSNGGKANYWGMYRFLPKETRGYVPNFIAVAQMLSNPTAFGLPAEVSAPEYAYDEVPVMGMLSIETIADMVGATAEEIRGLNPELKRNYLPPGSDPYTLRIPPGKADRFVAAFADLPDEAKRTAAQHTVRRGDNLGKIANRYGTTVRELMTANNLRKTTIYPGQRMVVPVVGGSNGQTSIVHSGIRTVNWGKRANQPISLDFTPKPSVVRATPVRQVSHTPPVASATTRQGSAKTINHRVRRGGYAR